MPAKLAFVAATVPEAQDAVATLEERFDHVAPDEADIIVALGGDGFMLQTLHEFIDRNVPIFGINRGSVGFLMNEYRFKLVPASAPEPFACS